MNQLSLSLGATRTRNGRTIPTCHPDRRHVARGLCNPCYCKSRKTADFKPSAPAPRSASCHPERKHYALDLCMACYERLKYHTESTEQREKRKARMAPISRKFSESRDRNTDEKAAKLRRQRWTAGKGKDYFKKRHLVRTELMAGRPRPGNCECCGAAERLVYDHCHTTERFRGWICNPCNKALGCVRDNPKHLQNLIAYLETQQVMRDPLADQQNQPADDRRPIWPTLQ